MVKQMPDSEKTDPAKSQQNSAVKNFDDKFNLISDDIGNLIVNIFHKMALFIIAAATIWAFSMAFIDMMAAGYASVPDLLLLFIFLELGAMVSIYFKTNRMPVRFLVYVAITALTRELINIANQQDKLDAIYIVMISGGILLLAVAVLVLRVGSFKYPTAPGSPTQDDS